LSLARGLFVTLARGIRFAGSFGAPRGCWSRKTMRTSVMSWRMGCGSGAMSSAWCPIGRPRPRICGLPPRGGGTGLAVARPAALQAGRGRRADRDRAWLLELLPVRAFRLL